MSRGFRGIISPSDDFISSITCASHTRTHLQHYSTPVSPESVNLLRCFAVKIPCAQWQATQPVCVCVCVYSHVTYVYVPAGYRSLE